MATDPNVLTLSSGQQYSGSPCPDLGNYVGPTPIAAEYPTGGPVCPPVVYTTNTGPFDTRSPASSSVPFIDCVDLGGFTGCLPVTLQGYPTGVSICGYTNPATCPVSRTAVGGSAAGSGVAHSTGSGSMSLKITASASKTLCQVPPTFTGLAVVPVAPDSRLVGVFTAGMAWVAMMSGSGAVMMM